MSAEEEDEKRRFTSELGVMDGVETGDAELGHCFVSDRVWEGV